MVSMPVFADDNIKQPALAGTWYPASGVALSLSLDQYFKEADVSENKDVGVVIAPHAGYDFSAWVAAYGYKAAAHRKIRTVILLAPTHHFSFKGASVWPKGAFQTPLGIVKVDEDFAEKLLAQDKRIIFRKDVFVGVPGRPENSVETQLPFIQKAFPGARIVPVILGFPPEPDMLRKMAEALASLSAGRDDVLLVVSVDQSHFHADTEARMIDQAGLDAISKMDIDAFWKGHIEGVMEVDGFHVVTTAMLYAQALGYQRAEVLKYATSAQKTKDTSSVVGYASVIFYREMPEGKAFVKTEKSSEVALLTGIQKKRLLNIARQTVDSFVTTGKAPLVQETDPRLSQEEGAFVTLKKNGQLRGCIGNIFGQGPLYATVREMAVEASAHDPRFMPVSKDELGVIDIEISVLSKPVRVKNANEILLGKHGVIVSKGERNRGVFLPQVATETGWSKEKFLSELCAQKAGLPPDAWEDPLVTLEVFTADVFGEKE